MQEGGKGRMVVEGVSGLVEGVKWFGGWCEVVWGRVWSGLVKSSTNSRGTDPRTSQVGGEMINFRVWKCPSV